MFLSRRYVYLILDFISVFTSMIAAMYLKDYGLLKNLIKVHTNIIVMFTVVQISVLFVTGIQKSMWRYTSIFDALKILVTSLLVVSICGVTSYVMKYGIPVEVFIINWFTLTTALVCMRVLARFVKSEYPEILVRKNKESVVIVGAGRAGQMLYREVNRNKNLNLSVKAFVDDDVKKIGLSIHGVPVFGKIVDLKKIVSKLNVNRVFIAIPSAPSSLIYSIVKNLDDGDYVIKTLPSMSEILNNKIGLDSLRNVLPEDLLSRQEVCWNVEEAKDFISGENVLVTGAGGSIGSELCKQIGSLDVGSLILFDSCEYNIYKIESDLKELFPDLSVVTLLGDVRDRDRLKSVFAEFKPRFVYHAAAYKHVPMVEKNPYEGIRTNILGTRNLAEISGIFNVSKFILVSTDKAVNPTNIMGATKRVAEIVVDFASKKFPATKFITVRFGNVLGSSGSVIPLFKHQISKGGPVTVTHKDIERFFMSIAEAAKLVIQSSLIGSGGEIFVLDMGKAVKIYDLAMKMISLAGLKEGVDISIEITGLRPGEKLFEELLADKELTIPTNHPKIRCAKFRESDLDIDIFLNKLIEIDSVISQEEYREVLKQIVPEYVPMIIKENSHFGRGGEAGTHEVSDLDLQT